jgi:anti-anti-sigma factor
VSQVPPPKHFEIESDQHGETVFLRLRGEFDLAGEQHFDSTVDRLALGAKILVVDLSGLTFIDSSGLRSLLRLWEHSRTEGVDLAVIRGDEQVQHTMKLTGLDAVLPFVDELEPRRAPSQVTPRAVPAAPAEGA